MLMTGMAGQDWAEAARTLASNANLSLQTFIIGGIGVPDPERRWREAYGVDDGGAVLVRPDGHVAWRRKSASPTPLEALSEAFTQILGKPV